MKTLAKLEISDTALWLHADSATILTAAEALLKKLRALDEYDSEHAGGYLTVMTKTAGEILLCCRIGAIPHLDDADPAYQTKARKYFLLSQEKAHRLMRNAATSGHLSSWQSRFPSLGQYAGAVWCDTFAVSFSGLPELADEALCLVLAHHFGWMDIDRAKSIAELSENPYFTPLLTAWLS